MTLTLMLCSSLYGVITGIAICQKHVPHFVVVGMIIMGVAIAMAITTTLGIS